MALALFDLDETLLPVDSDYLWSTFMVEKGYINDKDFITQKEVFKQEYIEGVLDIYEYIAYMAGYLNSLGAKRDHYQKEFIEEVIQSQVTDEAKALVAQHRSAGDYTVIITATNDFIVRDIAKFYEVDRLISTELETDLRDGALYFTGRPKGIPSFREGKVTRIEEFMKENPLYDWKGSSFYSDSCNDIPLLSRVDHPVAVNPDSELREHALHRGWEILDLHGKDQGQGQDID